jgi:hypothetical protein
VHLNYFRNFKAELFDIFAFLANHDARPCGIYRDVCFLRRPLNVNTADRCVLEFILDELTHQVVKAHILRERV